ESIGGNFVILDEDRDIVRIILKNKVIVDVSRCEGEGIEDDLVMRDFTIDAFAWHKDRGIIDVSGGVNDLKNKVIRAISEENLLSDPLRMLRAYRIAAEIGGVIEPETEKMIKRFSHMITYSAWERITEELFRLLNIPLSHLYLKMATETGVFNRIIPEIKDTDYAISMLRDVEMFIMSLRAIAKQSLGSGIASGLKSLAMTFSSGIPYYSIIKLSILLEELSSEVNTITRRLRLSNRWRKLIHKAVTSIGELEKYLRGESETIDLFLYFNKIGETNNAVIIITVAKLYHNRSLEYKKERLYPLLQKYDAYLERAKGLPIISGHEIIQTLGIPEGPRIGSILKKINDSYLIGEVNTREEAIDYLKTHF
ncbi:MAG: hypothetical protein AB1488_00095, partial [Nitrospirota bacterium]